MWHVCHASCQNVLLHFYCVNMQFLALTRLAGSENKMRWGQNFIQRQFFIFTTCHQTQDSVDKGPHFLKKFLLLLV